jgi:phage-related protein (TIGR01555 family)
MGRNRPRHQPKAAPQRPVAPRRIAPAVRGDDVVSTIGGGLGTEYDPAMGLWPVGYNFSNAYGLADAAYSNNEMVATIVEGLPDEAARCGCEVLVDDTEDPRPQPFLDEMERLEVLGKIATARSWARLYGGAGIVIDVDDGMDPALPLDPSKVRAINRLVPLDRWSLFPSDNTESPEFYTVAAYAGSFNALTTPMLTGIFHGSRVIRFVGRTVPPRIRIRVNGWGLSILDSVWPQIRNYDLCNQAMVNIANNYEHGVLKVRGLAAAYLAGEDAEVAERLRFLQQARSVVGAMVIDMDDEGFDRSTSTAGSGVEKIWQTAAAALAGAAHQPITRLLGQSPSGLSTDDNSGRRNWQTWVSVEQEKWFTPAIKRICTLLLDAGIVTMSEGAKFKVVWGATEVPTDEEQAKTLSLWADGMQKLVDVGVLDPMEVRAAFTQVGWSPIPRPLDAETRQSMSTDLSATHPAANPDARRGDLEALFNAPLPDDAAAE